MEIDPVATAATVAAGLAVAFRLGIWFYDRKVDAVLEVVRSFCAVVAVYHRLTADAEITDAGARELAGAVGKFITDLDALGVLACRDPPP